MFDKHFFVFEECLNYVVYFKVFKYEKARSIHYQYTNNGAQGHNLKYF